LPTFSPVNLCEAGFSMANGSQRGGRCQQNGAPCTEDSAQCLVAGAVQCTVQCLVAGAVQCSAVLGGRCSAVQAVAGAQCALTVPPTRHNKLSLPAHRTIRATIGTTPDGRKGRKWRGVPARVTHPRTGSPKGKGSTVIYVAPFCTTPHLEIE